MKKLLDAWKKRYECLPMKKKMAYSFSIPIICIFILVDVICMPIVHSKYREQLEYSIHQSCIQAESYLTNYSQNMAFIAGNVTSNEELKRSMSDGAFESSKEYGDQYREFLKLSDILSTIEFNNSEYHVGMYIPDDLFYSENNYYFYPESSLKALPYYGEIQEAFELGKVYYATIEETKGEYIALFQQMTVMTKDGERKHYVFKVEIASNIFKKILENAVTIPGSLIYLHDDKGEYLTASDSVRYTKLQSAGMLPDKKTPSWSQVKLDGENFYVIDQNMGSSNWEIYSLIPRSEFLKQSLFMLLWMGLITVLIAITVILVSYKLSCSYVKRLLVLNQKMKELENGDVNTRLVFRKEASGDELDELYRNFNYMTSEVRRLLKEHYRLGKDVMSAELKVLQAQINPHFLYNTLDLINWGAMDYGAKDVAEIARNLGQFYRLSLNHGKSAIQIADEIKHVELFIKIENVHFDDAIHVNMDISDDVLQYACLNTILQPFVENSIVHGIAEFSDIKQCHINITAKCEQSDILFIVSDDGPGMSEEKMAIILSEGGSNVNNGYGVRNINFRIKLCYGNPYGVSYVRNRCFGTEVHIRIPAMTFDELNNIL